MSCVKPLRVEVGGEVLIRKIQLSLKGFARDLKISLGGLSNDENE